MSKGSEDDEGDRESVTEDGLASLAWQKLRGTKMLSVSKPALFINSKEETKRKKTGCPGFGWDRVNFHKKLGGGTAGMADLN